jgi:hypothetical protein
MTYTPNGTRPRETYANPYAMPEALGEEEWETPEAVGEQEWESPEATYANPYAMPEAMGEQEWESPEATYANPYAMPEAMGEQEWESPEATYANPYAMPEAVGEQEWESPEATYANPYAMPEANPYSNLEDEWESPEAAAYANPYTMPEANPYSNPEDEADPFFPLLALAAKPLMGLAAKALPKLAMKVLPNVRRLLPFGRKLAGRVFSRVLGRARRFPQMQGFQRRFSGQAMGGMRPVTSGWQAPGPGTFSTRATLIRRRERRSTVAGLFRQLANIFGAGEREAAEMEASFFGTNEFEGELAGHELAHEAALTEVMAAEAAHTEDEAEAMALLGSTLPITIRIMGGRRALRRVMPTLVQSNARVISTLHRSGASGRQLLRVVPTIQRRTVASLRAIVRSGRLITPGLVAQIMAGHAARVLGTPQLVGRALVRNTAIRQGTVAPVGRRVRPYRTI